jgi:3-deoxy-D-manno-octulosonic-acid transferase
MKGDVQDKRHKRGPGWLTSVGAGALSRYIRFVYSSSRVLRSPPDSDKHLMEQHPCILAIWHGQFLMVPMYRPKEMKLRLMVARHADAELIAQTCARFDMGLIRGAGAGDSGKDKGGGEALRAAVETLRSGSTLAMTADVPPGPARVAGLGIVMIARISGRPIVPVAVATRRLVTFPTWSRFTLNLPLSRISGVAGEPIYVPRNVSNEEMEQFRLKVENALNDVTDQAFRMVGSDARRVLPASLQPPPQKGTLLSVYRAATAVAKPLAPVLLKRRAARGKEIVERVPERFGVAKVGRPDGALFWFHAASVGETNAVLPLIAALKARFPDLNVLLTTVTVTSAGIAARRLPEGALHQFMPLDSVEYVRRFLSHWRPDAAVFIESEIWPNLIMESAKNGLDLFLINARMSIKTAERWRRFSSLSKPVFGQFTEVLAQDARIAKRLKKVGARKVSVTGNLKYDAPPPPVDPNALIAVRDAIRGRPVFLAASTHPGEDEAVLEAHLKIVERVPDVLTVIVPRHPKRGDDVASLMTARGIAFARRSLGEYPGAQHGVYLADTLGELGLFYSLAQVSFVGRSLGARGGQNPIEAIKLGSAVIAGPNTANFDETYRVLGEAGGYAIVNDSAEMAERVAQLMTDSEARDALLRSATFAISGLGGALPKTLHVLMPYAEAAVAKHRAPAEPVLQIEALPQHAA